MLVVGQPSSDWMSQLSITVLDTFGLGWAGGSLGGTAAPDFSRDRQGRYPPAGPVWFRGLGWEGASSHPDLLPCRSDPAPKWIVLPKGFKLGKHGCRVPPP